MKLSLSYRRLLCVAGVVAAFLLPVFAHAQVAPLITQPVDATQRQPLAHSVHPLVKGAKDLGRADSSLPMKDMLLMLRPSASPAAIGQYIDTLHNPSSPSYHKWLTPEQYAAKFGVSDADIQAVSAWLTGSGFTVEQVARGKRWIRFSGTAALVETAFQTEIHSYSVNGGAANYANASGLSIPSALAPAVAGVVSMSSFQSVALHTAPQKLVRGSNGKLTLVPGTAVPTLQGAKPAFTATNGQTVNFLAPADFSAIYDAKPVVSSGIDGSGVSIAIVGRSDIAISDIESFRTISGLPFNDPTITYATTDPGVVPGDDIEASLDVEWAGAVAPQASINYVIGASTTTTDGVDISAGYIVDNVTAPIMNVSFGQCEQLASDSQIAFYQNLWQQAAAEGITVFIAAGDAGASACNDPNNFSTDYGFGVSALASTSYNVAVGGTELNDLSAQGTYWNTANGPFLGSAIGYIPEAVWNESCSPQLAISLTNCAFPPYNGYTFEGGGGASSCVSRTNDGFGDEYCAAGTPKPSWQTGSGVPQDGARDLPDVSLSAAAEHDPYIVCYESGCQWTTNSDGSITLQQADIIGGTSASSPAMASIMALVEQKAGAFQGVANYELYSLAAAQTTGSCDSSSRTDPTQPNNCVFNDITAGSNAVPCLSPGQDCSGTDGPVLVGESLPAPRALANTVTDGYSATAGYDLASGLGSVDVSNLVNSWSKPNLAPSATTLTLSQTTFAHGTTIAINGVVSPSSGTGTPTGGVIIKASNTSGEVVNLSLAAGAYSGSTINLPGGTYSVTATYSGDGVYAVSTSAPVSVTVTPESSTVTGISLAYPAFHLFGLPTLQNLTQALLGNPWFLQFNVAGTSGSTAATGTIKLTQGSNVIGTFPVSSAGGIYIPCGQGGSCDFPVGNYTFTAQYSGDSSFSPSSTTLQFTVAQGLADWGTGVSSPSPIANSQDIASVGFNGADPNFPPTGVMTFTRSDTGALLGSATLDKSGFATLPFNVGTGTYDILASWPGDANYLTGFGQNIAAQITTQSSGGTASVSISLNLGGSTFSLGQQTPYTVTVTPTQKNASTPVGSLALFSSSGEISSTVALSGGKASGTVLWGTAGPEPVYATYGGDLNFAGGSSSAVNVTVTQATPTLTVQPIAPYAGVGSVTSVSAIIGTPLASLNVPAPSGSVQFYDSLNGAAATRIGAPQGLTFYNGSTLLATLAPALPAGSNVLTAVYSGDANWKSVSSAASVPVVVTTPDFALTATPNPVTVTAGQSAALSIDAQSILGYDLPVTITCGGTLPPGVTCSTATVDPGAAGSITLATTAPGTVSATASAKSDSSLWKISGTAAFAALFFLFLPNRRRFAHLTVLLAAIALTFGMAGCGGGAPAPSSISLTSSSSKAASGDSVSFQASITSASDNSSRGTVTFYDGTTALGSAITPQNGVATYATTTLGVGTHSITAKYSGDSSIAASSSSDVLNQTITGQFTLTVNAASGSLQHSITVPATLQ